MCFQKLEAEFFLGTPQFHNTQGQKAQDVAGSGRSENVLALPKIVEWFWVFQDRRGVIVKRGHCKMEKVWVSSRYSETFQWRAWVGYQLQVVHCTHTHTHTHTHCLDSCGWHFSGVKEFRELSNMCQRRWGRASMCWMQGGVEWRKKDAGW